MAIDRQWLTTFVRLLSKFLSGQHVALLLSVITNGGSRRILSSRLRICRLENKRKDYCPSEIEAPRRPLYNCTSVHVHALHQALYHVYVAFRHLLVSPLFFSWKERLHLGNIRSRVLSRPLCLSLSPYFSIDRYHPWLIMEACSTEQTCCRRRGALKLKPSNRNRRTDIISCSAGFFE